MKQTVASLRAVRHRFGRQQALNGLDLSIRAGEVLGLLGPNGAGKTTAIRMLMGIIEPDHGVVEVFGARPGHAARLRTGVMLQLSGVPDTLTVGETIDMFRHYYPTAVPTDDLLALTGVGTLLDRRMGRLSGGQRQRVLLALAVCGEPELLILDEPTVGLDVAARRGLWDLIRQLAAAGRSILLATHHLEEADLLADRIVVLDQGRVIREGTPAQIKELVPTRRIRCRTSLPTESICRLPDVNEAIRSGDFVRIATGCPERVLRELLARDASLSDLEVTGAGLEEAFVALTDRVEAA